jgi:hypothetical protein
LKKLHEAGADFDRFYTDRQFEKDMAEIAEKLNELLDSAIVYENYQQMPSLVNIFSRAMYMTFRNLMLFHIND